MPDQMTKAQYMEMLHTERARWDALLDEVGEARMTEPGVAGKWSVKDVIAHVTWSEREMVGVLRERALGGSELWRVNEDERNAAVYEQNRDRPLDEVLRESREVYQQLLELLEDVTDEDLNDNSRFRNMIPGVPLWQLLDGNTAHHYRAHASGVRAWLDTRTAL